MTVCKIVGIGIIGTVLAVLVKQYRPELAAAVSIITSFVILLACVPCLSAVIASVKSISEQAGIKSQNIEIVFKIIGISYICKFASDICKDAGETSISGKIELGGKIVILLLSMPIIYSLLETINNMIN